MKNDFWKIFKEQLEQRSIKQKADAQNVTIKLYRVEAPHFTAGFLVSYGKVITAAPIIAYLINKPFSNAEKIALQKNWKLEVIS